MYNCIFNKWRECKIFCHFFTFIFLVQNNTKIHYLFNLSLSSSFFLIYLFIYLFMILSLQTNKVQGPTTWARQGASLWFHLRYTTKTMVYRLRNVLLMAPQLISSTAATTIDFRVSLYVLGYVFYVTATTPFSSTSTICIC